MLSVLSLSLALVAQDPVDQLDAKDPWLRAWAESVVDRSGGPGAVDLVLERTARAARLRSRRRAVTVRLVGRLTTSRREDRRRAELLVQASVAVRWDAFFLRPPDERLLIPGEEKRRLRYCVRLSESAGSVLEALERAARLDALGCG